MKEKKEQIHHFFEVFARFYAEEVTKQKGFLRDYLEFERHWRLCLAAYRAKKLNRDLVKELQFEDLQDPFIVFLLVQKESATFEFPYEFKDLGHLLEGVKDPLDQHRIIQEYRFKKLEELASGPLFSIDWLLSYMVQLMVLEDLRKLNEEEGKALFTRIKEG